MNARAILDNPTTGRGALNTNRARDRFRTLEKRPLFLADWMDALFIHFEIDPDRLRPAIPFELDLFEGRAHVSLVAFSMRRLRPGFGGAAAAAPFLLLGTTRFLNVRTYVRCQGESGIYFITEFISSRISVPLGPITYGLPYHFARLDYDCDAGKIRFAGRVRRREGRARELRFDARIDSPDSDAPNPADARTRFLTEKYTAYTCHGGKGRRFRVWHEPWPLRRAEVTLHDDSLLDLSGAWPSHARRLGANYSPGIKSVWMSKPTRVPTIRIITHTNTDTQPFLSCLETMKTESLKTTALMEWLERIAHGADRPRRRDRARRVKPADNHPKRRHSAFFELP